MRTITVEGNIITFDGHVAQATFHPESIAELQECHDIDVPLITAIALTQELDVEFGLTPDEKVYCQTEIAKHI